MHLGDRRLEALWGSHVLPGFLLEKSLRKAKDNMPLFLKQQVTVSIVRSFVFENFRGKNCLEGATLPPFPPVAESQIAMVAAVGRKFGRDEVAHRGVWGSIWVSALCCMFAIRTHVLGTIEGWGVWGIPAFIPSKSIGRVTHRWRLEWISDFSQFPSSACMVFYAWTPGVGLVSVAPSLLCSFVGELLGRFADGHFPLLWGFSFVGELFLGVSADGHFPL